MTHRGCLCLLVKDETFLRLFEANVHPGIDKDLGGKVSVLTLQEMAAHRLRGHVF